MAEHLFCEEGLGEPGTVPTAKYMVHKPGNKKPTPMILCEEHAARVAELYALIGEGTIRRAKR